MAMEWCVRCFRVPALPEGQKSAAPAIYEVKVSRADFLADLAKPEKRLAYAALAEAVYYCCPEGLICKEELPEGFGLLCEMQGQFELHQEPCRRAKGFELAADTAMTLMVKRPMPSRIDELPDL